MRGSHRCRNDIVASERREKMLESHPKRADEIEEFKVSHPHKLALDFREGTPRNIKSLAREDFGEFRLRPAELAS